MNIMFVCHGNICRSTMAEFVFKDIVRKKGLEDVFYIASSATSREEIGNDIHPGTRRKLTEVGVPFTRRRAVQMTKADYAKYDLLIGMDSANIRNMMRIIGSDPENKVHLLLEYAGLSRGIADPWYTGNFEDTYADVRMGCDALFEYLKKENMI